MNNSCLKSILFRYHKIVDYQRILRMKITTIIFFIGMVQIQAATFAQQLTLTHKNVSITRIFDEIKKQTGYDVFYLPKVLNTDRKIDVKFDKASLSEVMEVCLRGQQVSYAI